MTEPTMITPAPLDSSDLPRYWDREAEPSLTGVIENIGLGSTRFGEKKVADIRKRDGTLVRVYIADERLVELFDPLNPMVGDKVRIQFLGPKQGPRFQMYDYDVTKVNQRMLEDMRGFLEALGRGSGGLQELRLVGRRVEQQFFRVEDAEGGADYAATHAAQADVYLGVGVRGVPRGRGEDVIRVGAMWADLDGNLDTAEAFPLPASIRIASGSRGHQQWYWLLDQPVVTTDPRARSRWEGLNKALARRLDADKCFDLPRVLRVPGTVNHKNDAPVELLFMDVNRTYSVEEMEEALGGLEDSVVVLPGEGYEAAQTRS